MHYFLEPNILRISFYCSYFEVLCLIYLLFFLLFFFFFLNDSIPLVSLTSVFKRENKLSKCL